MHFSLSQLTDHLSGTTTCEPWLSSTPLSGGGDYIPLISPSTLRKVGESPPKARSKVFGIPSCPCTEPGAWGNPFLSMEHGRGVLSLCTSLSSGRRESMVHSSPCAWFCAGQIIPPPPQLLSPLPPPHPPHTHTWYRRRIFQAEEQGTHDASGSLGEEICPICVVVLWGTLPPPHCALSPDLRAMLSSR